MLKTSITSIQLFIYELTFINLIFATLFLSNQGTPITLCICFKQSYEDVHLENSILL